MAEKEQQVTVKEDGADVHYHLDAKSPEAAKKIVAAVQDRREERVAREGGAGTDAAGDAPISTAERALGE